MKYVVVLFLLLIGCGHAQQEVADALGCHVAGNDCPGVDYNDPNLRGPRGEQGAPGEIGPIGPRGPVGADGTPVSTIQFCPGTPNYPSTFPEVGVCISGNLYAVYSTNGGFLALLTPGRYSSNAVGSRCSFTVFTGCAVGDQL